MTLMTMERAGPGLARAKALILGLSRQSCYLVFGVRESWCARAWRMRDDHGFWAAWVRVFGQRHCEKSWRHYHG